MDYGRALTVKAGLSGSGINGVVYMGTSSTAPPSSPPAAIKATSTPPLWSVMSSTATSMTTTRGAELEHRSPVLAWERRRHQHAAVVQRELWVGAARPGLPAVRERLLRCLGGLTPISQPKR